MEVRYYKQYSPALERDMECKVYGHAGRPVLFIPCQDGRFFDFENFHMTDVWAPWIDSGKVMVIPSTKKPGPIRMGIRAGGFTVTSSGFDILLMR